jgi:hypothetical protein
MADVVGRMRGRAAASTAMWIANRFRLFSTLFELVLVAVARLLLDRTVVLFLGIAAGLLIGLSFIGAEPPAVVAAVPVVAPVAVATAVPAELPPEACAVRFAPGLVTRLAAGQPVRVGVFGDSFGDGLWAALYNQLPKRDGFQVERLSQQSTGFTRYASLNLETHLGEQLATTPVDIAVISFGANDTQGVMANGKFAALLSEAWQAEVGRRIEGYVGRLRDEGVMVYWIGLPAMREAKFDAEISGLNAFHARVMARLGVPFIATRGRSLDAEGRYAAWLPDPETGAPRLIRANDGIHMSMRGYGLLTDGVAARIKAHVTAAKLALPTAKSA